IAGLAAYAARMHALAGDRHHVVSPLGAWLLVAICHGFDDAAARTAAALLDEPHPVVGAAAAAWTRSATVDRARLDQWRATLPAAVATGDMPTQDELDRWAAEHTLGLIERFPVQVPPEAAFLL